MSYFDEQIATGKPIVPPPPPPTIPQIPLPPTPPGEKVEGLPVRAAGDRIFLLWQGRKRWVTSPEVYANLGFKFGDEVRIDQATLDVIPDGEPLR